MAQFGWANGMQNMGFMAGRVSRHPDNDRTYFLQQTPNIAQRLAVLSDRPLSHEYPNGSYISVFSRLRGRVLLDADKEPAEAGVILQGLHVRFTNGMEVDPDEAQSRLMRALVSVPKDAKVDKDLQAMDVATPDEIKDFVSDPLASTPEAGAQSADPDAFKKDARLIPNGNHATIAGVIGFMEYRESSTDRSQNRVQLFIQQNAKLEEAIAVRVYGKQAAIVANTYRPGHAVFAKGEVQVDVKRQSDGNLRTTSYFKTYSVESAQPPHIRVKPYPEWALKLYEEGQTDIGFAKRVKQILIDSEPRPEASASSHAAVA